MNLEKYQKLLVKQKIEKLEVITGIESKNNYEILSLNEEKIYFAYEKSNSLIRVFFRRYRGLSLFLTDNNKNILLKLEKKFAFFLPEFNLFDSNNNKLWKIKMKFGIIKKFQIFNNKDELLFELSNTNFSPWTFNFYNNNNNKINSKEELATISKKWSGIKKEVFTNSDNFLIDFKLINQNSLKELILILSFIIDLTCFEK